MVEFTVEKCTSSEVTCTHWSACLCPPDVDPVTLKSLGHHDSGMQPPQQGGIHKDSGACLQFLSCVP